ncbi:unnamed protein product [Trifolium pratense]|uniref:Uncharacterized protein n=1 Tax=Trifolium pratense TaxID=57577 RepID=A0ACB0JJA5_TRIPR|nr:unnamed protein product [Trifolium pratense]
MSTEVRDEVDIDEIELLTNVDFPQAINILMIGFLVKVKFLIVMMMLIIFTLRLHKEVVSQLDVITFIETLLMREIHKQFTKESSFAIDPGFLNQSKLMNWKVKGNGKLQGVVVVLDWWLLKRQLDRKKNGW